MLNNLVVLLLPRVTQIKSPIGPSRQIVARPAPIAGGRFPINRRRQSLVRATSDAQLRELGQAVSLESNTLTPLLKRLEALDLISRTRDPKDERQVRIRLTRKGRELKAQAEHVPACVATALGLSFDELKQLCQTLSLVRSRLEHAEQPSLAVNRRGKRARTPSRYSLGSR